jgi:hypothetical protein
VGRAGAGNDRAGAPWDLRVAGDVAAASVRLGAAAHFDWTSNPALARALAPTPHLEARRAARSAAAVAWTEGDVRVALVTSLVQDLDAATPADGLRPVTAVEASLLPLRAGPVWLGLDTSAATVWTPGARARAWPAWRALLEPHLAVAGAVGPLATRWTLTSRHAVWNATEPGAATASRHLVVAAADLAVPLVASSGGVGRRLQHTLTPRVRYRLTLADTLALPATLAVPADPAAWPAPSHVVEVRLAATSRPAGSDRGLRADVAQEIPLPGLAGVDLPPRLRAELELDRPLAAVVGHLALDEERLAVDEARVAARFGAERATGARVGWRWLDPDARHAAGWDPADALAVVVPFRALSPAHSLDVAAWVALGPTWRLEAGALVDLTGRALLRAGGAVRYAHRCGCLRAGVEAWSRAGRPWPDVLLTLDLSGRDRL